MRTSRRLLLVLVCGAALTVWGQEGEPKAGEHAATEQHEAKGAHEEGGLEGWKWANFAILAIALGYMLGKALPPFFKSRTAEIQKGIAEAQKMKADAEKRAADMERRLAALSTEVAQIRTEAGSVMAREAERIAKDTDAHMARIQTQAEQEISAITKHATQALKAHAAELALELAAQRISGRMDATTQGNLVNRFVRQLESTKGEARI